MSCRPQTKPNSCQVQNSLAATHVHTSLCSIAQCISKTVFFNWWCANNQWYLRHCPEVLYMCLSGHPLLRSICREARQSRVSIQGGKICRLWVALLPCFSESTGWRWPPLHALCADLPPGPLPQQWTWSKRTGQVGNLEERGELLWIAWIGSGDVPFWWGG